MSCTRRARWANESGREGLPDVLFHRQAFRDGEGEESIAGRAGTREEINGAVIGAQVVVDRRNG